MTVRYTISILSTVAVLVASVLYLSFGVLKMRAGDQTTVTITAPKSNGLHAGSAVLLRGVPIGSVQELIEMARAKPGDTGTKGSG